MKKISSILKISAIVAVSAVVVFAGASFMPDNNEWLVSSKIGSETETLASQKNIHDKYIVEKSTETESDEVKTELDKPKADSNESATEDVQEVSEKEETTETVEKPSTSEKKEDSKPSTQSTTSEKKEEVAVQPEQVVEQPVYVETPAENNTPQPAVHEHNWVAETIHHDAVTHQETVTNTVHHDAVTEYEYVPVIVCECGGRFDDGAEFDAHECDTCQWSCLDWEKRTTEVSPAWDEEVTETVTITDSPAWDEVIYRCSGCGQCRD